MSAKCILMFLLATYHVASGLKTTLTDGPSDVTAVTGDDVILTCIVANVPVEGYQVQWTKGGFALGYVREIPGIPNYAMVGDISTGHYDLQITNISLYDESEYECQVKDYMQRAEAKVTVLVPPQGPEIDDVEDKSDVINVLAYSENLITCRSWHGKPAAHLAWFKDGEKVEENVTYAETDASQKLRNSSATLRLWPSEDDDGSVYECEMVVDLRIQNALPDAHNWRRSVKLNVQKPPLAQISLSKEDAEEGSTVVARCDSSDSKPMATSFIWSLDGEIMQGKTGSTVYFDNVNRTINGVEIACRSVNSVGQSHPSSAIFNVLYAPKIITSPRDVVTNMSATVNFTCSWDSNPPALITWYKRGKQDKVVGEGELLTVEVNEQSAAGTYVCVSDASGVGSESVSATLDVLGPPLFQSPGVQEVTPGNKGTVECTLASKPGISHVIWTWERDGEVMVLENNETITAKKDGREQTKYAGLVEKGGFTALLLIYDVKKEDLIEYNCTVHNDYGVGSTTIPLKEAPVSKGSFEMIVGILIGAVLIIIAVIVVSWCCLKRRRERKSTTFTPEHESLHEKRDPEKGDHREDDLDNKPSNGKLLSPDADDDNPSTSASLSSRDVRGSIVVDEFHRGSAHNDDGYHTEEANSWNRAEKLSPDSSPARSARDDYHRHQGMPSSPLTSSPVNAFDAYASDAGTDDGQLKYNMQPYYPGPYGPNGMVDLPPVRETRTMSPVNMYGGPPHPDSYYHGPPPTSSGYRSAAYPPSYSSGYQRARAGSNTPSLVSSQRSVTPSPAYAAMLGRSTPVSVLGDRSYYVVPTVQPQHGPSSSQSSLENPPSSVAANDPYENAAKMSQLSSRISQASRSSEFLNKQMTARMATHV